MAYYQFSNSSGEAYGSCEIFRWNRFDCQYAGLIEQDPESSTGWSTTEQGIGGFFTAEADPADYEGWYWRACWPGCLPDGDPMGPFSTEQDAMDDAGIAD